MIVRTSIAYASTQTSSKVSDEIYVFKFWKWLLPVSYINGVFRIIEEIIRIVNKLKKLIAKTLLYVVLVESDYSFSAKRSISSGLTLSNLPRKQNLERSSSYADGRWANGMKTGGLPAEYNYWHIHL